MITSDDTTITFTFDDDTTQREVDNFIDFCGLTDIVDFDVMGEWRVSFIRIADDDTLVCVGEGESITDHELVRYAIREG